MCPTDLRAARGAAHIRPVLFVIHVIGRPTKQKKHEQHFNLPPHHAVCMEVWCRSQATVTVQSFHSAGSLSFSALFLFAQCRQLNHTLSLYDTFILLLPGLYCGSGA